MEEEGIGRPSTYATIVKGLRTKICLWSQINYSFRFGKSFNFLPEKIFEEFFIETEFTARMEAD